MCRAATCPICSKATWFGCGLHIPSVMDQVSESDRCTCEPKHEFNGKQYPPKSGTGSAAPGSAAPAVDTGSTKVAAPAGGYVEGAKNFMGWVLGNEKKDESEAAKKDEPVTPKKGEL